MVRWFLLWAILWGGGCVEQGTTDLSGAILGSTFEAIDGSAESDGSGYTITIADSSAFSCSPFGAPPDQYLSVVIGAVDGPLTMPAAGIVFFNSFEAGLNSTEAATSGSVTIDILDLELGEISGSVSAEGETSSVDGAFSVQICG